MFVLQRPKAVFRRLVDSEALQTACLADKRSQTHARHLDIKLFKPFSTSTPLVRSRGFACVGVVNHTLLHVAHLITVSVHAAS